MVKRQFIKGAWLHTDDKISEEDFIAKCGGLDALEPYREFPFVSLVLDSPDSEKPLIVGHNNGRTISLAMQGQGHEQFQTMEWK